MVLYNPFTSKTFQRIWLQHFYPYNDFQEDLTDNKVLACVSKNGLYSYNIGATLTKGMTYSTTHINAKTDLPFLIYDVPTYFKFTNNFSANLGCYISRQYPGFLIELDKFKNFDDYFQQQFSKSSRSKIRKYKKRLEQSFPIKEMMYKGHIEKKTFKELFDYFRALLEKRFEDKQIYNNNLDDKEWSFYQEVAYELINEDKAGLYVIYDGEVPISLTLLYFSDTIVFDAITVFDIDYSKFNVGSTTNVNIVDWCFKHKMKVFDFSKGYFEYKTRWCTKIYDFHYHIIYKKSNLKSQLTAMSLKILFDFKQFLRSKNVNEKLHRLKWRLNNKNKASAKGEVYTFKFIEVDETDALTYTKQVDFNQPALRNLKLAVYEYLYLFQDEYGNIRLYQANTINTYIIKSNKRKIKLELVKDN